MAETPENDTAPEATPEAAPEAAAQAAPEEGKGIELDELEATPDTAEAKPSKNGGGEAQLEAVYDIPVRVSAVLGETQMEINKLLKLGRGAVVVLDRKIGEAIDIYVNDRLVARGEVVVADEDKLGVTMTEIVKSVK